MRARKGFTVVELMIGLSILSFTMMATFGLLLTGLRSADQAMTDVELSQPNAQALRRISETVRRAVTVTVADSGYTLHYTLPKTTTGADLVTGEAELVVPVQGDGVARSFAVVSPGQLVVRPSSRVLVDRIISTDPNPKSSQYQKTYAPFSVTTIGSRRAITINLITQQLVNGKPRYSRLKTTVLVQNIR